MHKISFMLKTYINQLLSSLDLLGGAFSGVIVLVTAASYLFNGFSKAPLLLKSIALSAMLLVVIFVLRQFRKIKDTVDEKLLSKEIGRKIVKDKKAINFEPTQIPTTSEIKKWVKLLSIKARKWSTDAEISSYSFFYTLRYFRDSGINHSFGVSFYSKQKDEQLNLSISEDSEHLSEPIGRTKPRTSIEYGEAPFYMKIPNWRKALEYLYRRMEDKVDDNFEIRITNGTTKMVFLYFSYTYGPKRIHATFNASYDGKILTFEKTGEKINLT